jgi:hypothetical protein
MRPYSLAVFVVAFAARATSAQSLSQQVRSSNGAVEVIYPSRANVCGDGQGSISNVMGRSGITWSDGGSTSGGGWHRGPCVHGPARLVLTVVDGDLTRARVYVGPPSTPQSNTRTINASASDASTWLADLVEHAPTRVASDLLVPLIVADGAEPWPFLLKLVRSDTRSSEFKRSAMMWLSNAVSDRLGILDETDRDDNDEVRSQAVYVLTQRPKSEGIPALIDVAKTAAHPSARKAAIYWLGQSGDPRAADVYAELLGLK